MDINTALIMITRPHSGIKWHCFFDSYFFPCFCSRHTYTQNDEATINLILADIRTTLSRDNTRYTLINSKLKTDLGLKRLTYNNTTLLLARALWAVKLKVQPGELSKFYLEGANGYGRRQ